MDEWKEAFNSLMWIFFLVALAIVVAWLWEKHEDSKRR